MEQNAIQMLDSHCTMAISTIRPDGWPQTTIVGYAKDALVVYFLISRSSQKFANMQHDNRVSFVVSQVPKNIYKLMAVYADAPFAIRRSRFKRGATEERPRKDIGWIGLATRAF